MNTKRSSTQSLLPVDSIDWLMDEVKQQHTLSTGRTHLRVFKVEHPVTVFVRASRCRINIQYHELEQVELHARLYNAFGLRFVTEQDDAGVYVIVKRRRLLGWISRADFLLRVPHFANLAFNLSPGTIKLD